MTGPAIFPIGSAESRAAARLLAQSRAPIRYVMEMDDDGEPIRIPGVRYAPAVVLVPRQLTHEEWTERYCPREGETPEEHRARLDAMRPTPEARARWLARYRQATAAEDAR